MKAEFAVCICRCWCFREMSPDFTNRRQGFSFLQTEIETVLKNKNKNPKTALVNLNILQIFVQKGCSHPERSNIYIKYIFPSAPTDL